RAPSSTFASPLSPHALHSHDLPSFPTRRSSDLQIFCRSSPDPAVRSRSHTLQARPSTVSVPVFLKSCDSRHCCTLPVTQPTGISDRKSTRLNSSHVATSYAVFCLQKKSTKSRSR